MKREQRTVKHGTWLYGGTVQFDVWIVTQNYIDDPGATEEEKALYPYRDGDSIFFAAYGQNDAWTGISHWFRTKEEAVARAEQTITGKITWDA